MSKSSFSRTPIAIAATLATSTIAIGAAVGPAQANANPVATSIGYNLNA